MVKRGSIRALVLYSRSGLFYVNGLPDGIYYEALQYFERFVNQRLHTRQHVQVTYIPVRPDQLEDALTEGGTAKEAPSQGLNPNVWFGNLELLVSKSVGPVTVQYVSNIYKYYVAYQLVVEQGQSLQ